MKRETVSLCMIVRDEGDCLAACLASAQPFVQEIIVVDTGSTDDTRAVAEGFGAKVFDYPWGGNFAEARNYSLSMASGGWILVLDADERLTPVDGEVWQGLLRDPAVEGYYLKIHSWLGGGEWTDDFVVRLFRNKPEYRFVGPIHEQVAGAIQDCNGGGGLAFAPLEVRHHGYLPERIRQKDKGRRNRGMLEKALQERPDDPFLLYCLGCEWLQAGRPEAGCACLERALKGLTGSEGYCRDAVVLYLLGWLSAALQGLGEKDGEKVLGACRAFREAALAYAKGMEESPWLGRFLPILAEELVVLAEGNRRGLAACGFFPAARLSALVPAVLELLAAQGRAGAGEGAQRNGEEGDVP